MDSRYKGRQRRGTGGVARGEHGIQDAALADGAHWLRAAAEREGGGRDGGGRRGADRGGARDARGHRAELG